MQIPCIIDDNEFYEADIPILCAFSETDLMRSCKRVANLL